MSDAPLRASWEVIWLNGKKKARVQCGYDHQHAVDLYCKAVAAGKRAVTLRCKNMSFPPPLKYADREVVIVSVGGKPKKAKKIIKPFRYRDAMNSLNRKGIWWCPFCQQMRKFVKRKGFRREDVWVQLEHLACPMCGISHIDGAVQKYNPLALSISLRKESSRRVEDPNEDPRKRATRERRAERRRQRQKEAAGS